MGDEIRYGVIGTGMMGVEHISNLLAIDGVRVTAIADPDERSLDWAHNAVGIDAPLARFSDHRQLIESGECDAVVIASPNHTHRAVLADVLDSPLHVMVEKPLCTTMADCRAVVERAAAGPPDRVVWMGLEYRYMPPTQRLLAEVRGGTVGNVRMVAIREHRFPFLHKVGNWNRFSRNTGGTLVEKCCHYFDLMNLVIGSRPQRVDRLGRPGRQPPRRALRRRGARRHGQRLRDRRVRGGVRAMLDLCMFAEASKNEQEVCVVGDEGRVEALVSESVLRVGRRADGVGKVSEHLVSDDRVHFQGFHHGSSYLEHLDFRDAIRAGTPAAVTLEDGLWAVAVGEAGHRSIDERRWVDLAELVA